MRSARVRSRYIPREGTPGGTRVSDSSSTWEVLGAPLAAASLVAVATLASLAIASSSATPGVDFSPRHPLAGALPRRAHSDPRHLDAPRFETVRFLRAPRRPSARELARPRFRFRPEVHSISRMAHRGGRRAHQGGVRDPAHPPASGFGRVRRRVLLRRSPRLDETRPRGLRRRTAVRQQLQLQQGRGAGRARFPRHRGDAPHLPGHGSRRHVRPGRAARKLGVYAAAKGDAARARGGRNPAAGAPDRVVRRAICHVDAGLLLFAVQGLPGRRVRGCDAGRDGRRGRRGGLGEGGGA